MIKFIRSLFAWRLIRSEIGSFYYQNDVTGKRKAWCYRNAKLHPGTNNWLNGGDWSYIRPPAPKGWSAVIPPPPIKIEVSIK
jgi:hypothetical protein